MNKTFCSGILLVFLFLFSSFASAQDAPLIGNCGINETVVFQGRLVSVSASVTNMSNPLDWFWVALNETNSSGISVLNGNGTLEFAWNSAGFLGNYSVKCWVNDSLGLANWSVDGWVAVVTTTTLPPFISNISLTMTQVVQGGSTDVMAVIINASYPLDRWWFTFNQTTNSSNMGVGNISAAGNGSNSLAWNTSGVSVGEYILVGFVNDTAGNMVRSANEKWVNVTPQLPPTMILYQPAPGASIGSGFASFQVSCLLGTAPSLANVSLYINASGWGIKNSTASPTGGENISLGYTMGPGDYLWNAVCYDANGNSDWGDANRTLFVTTTTTLPPFISGCQPSQSVVLKGVPVVITAMAVRTSNSLNSFWFAANETNLTVVPSVNGSNNVTWNTVSFEGNYSIKCWVNDSVGLASFSQDGWVAVVTTTTTTLPPTGGLASPPNGGSVPRGIVDFQVVCTPESAPMQNASLYVNASGWGIKNSTVTGGGPVTLGYTLATGSYIWNALCYDQAGNGVWGNASNFTLTVTPSYSVTLVVDAGPTPYTTASFYVYDSTKNLLFITGPENRTVLSYPMLPVGNFIAVAFNNANVVKQINFSSVDGEDRNITVNMADAVPSGRLSFRLANITNGMAVAYFVNTSQNVRLYNSSNILLYAQNNTDVSQLFDAGFPLPFGQYYIAGDAAGMPSRTFRGEITVSRQGWDESKVYGMTSSSMGNITGIILIPSGAIYVPLAGASVEAFIDSVQIAGEGRNVILGSAMSDANGRYSIRMPMNYTAMTSQGSKGACINVLYDNPLTPGLDYMLSWSSADKCNRPQFGPEQYYVAPYLKNITLDSAGTVSVNLTGGNGNVYVNTVEANERSEDYWTVDGWRIDGMTNGSSSRINLRTGQVIGFVQNASKSALTTITLSGVGNLVDMNLDMVSAVPVTLNFTVGGNQTSAWVTFMQGSEVKLIHSLNLQQDNTSGTVLIPAGIYNITAKPDSGDWTYANSRVAFYNVNVSSPTTLSAAFGPALDFWTEMSESAVVNTTIKLRTALMVQGQPPQPVNPSGWNVACMFYYANNSYAGQSATLTYENTSGRFVGDVVVQIPGSYYTKYVAQKNRGDYFDRQVAAWNTMTVSGLGISVNLGREDQYMTGSRIEGSIQVRYANGSMYQGTVTANVTTQMQRMNQEPLDLETLQFNVTDGLGILNISTANATLYQAGDHMMKVIVAGGNDWGQVYRWFGLQSIKVTGDGDHEVETGGTVDVIITVTYANSTPVQGAEINATLRQDMTWSQLSFTSATTDNNGQAQLSVEVNQGGQFVLEVLATSGSDIGRYFHGIQSAGLGIQLDKDGPPPVLQPGEITSLTYYVTYLNGSAAPADFSVELREQERFQLLDSFYPDEGQSDQEAGKFVVNITAPADEGFYMMRAVASMGDSTGTFMMPLTVSRLDVNVMPDSWSKGPADNVVLTVRARYASNNTPVNGVVATAGAHKDMSWELDQSNSTTITGGLGTILLTPPAGNWTGGFHPVEVTLAGFAGSFPVGFVVESTKVELALTGTQPYNPTDTFNVTVNATDLTTQVGVDGNADLNIFTMSKRVYKRCTLSGGVCTFTIEIAKELNGTTIGGTYGMDVFAYGNGVAGGTFTQFDIKGLNIGISLNKPMMQKYLPGETIVATLTVTNSSGDALNSGGGGCQLFNPRTNTDIGEAPDGNITNGSVTVSLDTTGVPEDFYMLTCKAWDEASGISGRKEYPVTLSAMDVKIGTDRRTYQPTDTVNITVRATSSGVPVNGTTMTAVFGPQKEHFLSGEIANGLEVVQFNLAEKYGGSAPTGSYFGVGVVTSSGSTGSQPFMFDVESLILGARFNESSSTFQKNQSVLMTLNLTYANGTGVSGADLTIALVSMKQGKVGSSLSNTTDANGLFTMGVSASSTQGDYAYLITAESGSEKAFAELPFRVTGLEAVVVTQDANGNLKNIFSSNSSEILVVNVSLFEGGSPAESIVMFTVYDANNLALARGPIYVNNTWIMDGSTAEISSGWYYIQIDDPYSNPIGTAAFKVI